MNITPARVTATLFGLVTVKVIVLTAPAAIVAGVKVLVAMTGALAAAGGLTTSVPLVLAVLPALPVTVTPVLLRNTPPVLEVVLTVRVQLALALTLPA